MINVMELREGKSIGGGKGAKAVVAGELDFIVPGIENVLGGKGKRNNRRLQGRGAKKRKIVLTVGN